MADNPAFPEVLRLKSFVSCSLSTDGKAALFMGEREEGGRGGFIISTELLEDLRSYAHTLRQQAEQRGVSATWVRIRPIMPEEFLVGDSDEHRGCAVVVLDPNTAKEMGIAFVDQAAMKLAQLLVANVRKRHKSIIIPAG